MRFSKNDTIWLLKRECHSFLFLLNFEDINVFMCQYTVSLPVYCNTANMFFLFFIALVFVASTIIVAWLFGDTNAFSMFLTEGIHDVVMMWSLGFNDCRNNEVHIQSDGIWLSLSQEFLYPKCVFQLWRGFSCHFCHGHSRPRIMNKTFSFPFKYELFLIAHPFS